MNLKSEFINAPLNETVNLTDPQGMQININEVCLRLHKDLYGIKQEALAWYNCLSS